MEEQVNGTQNIFDRKNFTGHIVANTLIIHHNKVLVIFHNFLQKYLQPGGHVDSDDSSVLQAAVREAKEETGIDDFVLYNWNNKEEIPIFIESHFIEKTENPALLRAGMNVQIPRNEACERRGNMA